MFWKTKVWSDPLYKIRSRDDFVLHNIVAWIGPKKVICTPTQKKNYQEKKILKAIYNIYIIIHISKSCIFAQAWLISKILCSCHVCGSIYTANLNWNWTQKKHTYKKHVLCERNVTVIFYLFCMWNRIFSFVILII